MAKTNVECFVFHRKDNGQASIKIITDKQVIDILSFLHERIVYEFGYYGSVVEDTAYSLLEEFAGKEIANKYYQDFADRLGAIDYDKGGTITAEELCRDYGIPII